MKRTEAERSAISLSSSFSLFNLLQGGRSGSWDVGTHMGANKNGPNPNPSTKMDVIKVLIVRSERSKCSPIRSEAGAGMEEAAVDMNL